MNRCYKILDRITRLLTLTISLLVAGLLIFIIGKIFTEGMQVFKSTSFFEFVTRSRWRPLSDPPQLGVSNMILGTVSVSLIALVISLPVSIGSALFIVLKTKEKGRIILLALIDLMIGVPSVVYGFVSFMLLVLFFERYLSFGTGESLFIAGFTVAIMVMPLMISTMTQSMDKVLQAYKKSASALGVSHEYMAIKLILPASKKGIVLAIFLAFSRAMGETMAVAMVIGNSNLKPLLFGKGITLSGLITLEMGSAVLNSLHYKGLYAAGFVLMLLLLLNNILFAAIKKWVEND